MITESMIPIILMPATFLFVLLIILIAKAPKTGAWVVGGLVLLAPIFLYRLATTGALRHEEAIPVVVLPVTFLFVLLVILLAKAPKAGGSLVVALVVMGLFALLVMPLVSHHRAAYETTSPPAHQWTESAAEKAALIQETQGVFQEYTDVSARIAVPAVPSPEPPTPPAALSPIWSEGVERQFEADVYPSRLAAVRALGLRLDRAVRALTGDVHAPQITLFQGEFDRALLVELKNTVQQALSQATCAIEAELRNLRPGEVGVTVRLVDRDGQDTPWTQTAKVETVKGEVSVVHRSVVMSLRRPAGSGFEATSGNLEIDAFNTSRHITSHKRFVEKPWVENFGVFASERPEQHFIITRSREACTSESEARQQVLEDARARLAESLGRYPAKLPGQRMPAVATRDVLQGGFIVDQFAQSFDGTAGKIWREAMLLDVSGPKLGKLFAQKVGELRETRMSWARMGFSAIGVVVLIAVIYFFLNMATMGYYEWSLRIAGVILAIVAVISILMVVR
jgi:hypothetical protein